MSAHEWLSSCAHFEADVAECLKKEMQVIRGMFGRHPHPHIAPLKTEPANQRETEDRTEEETGVAGRHNSGTTTAVGSTVESTSTDVAAPVEAHAPEGEAVLVAAVPVTVGGSHNLCTFRPFAGRTTTAPGEV